MLIAALLVTQAFWNNLKAHQQVEMGRRSVVYPYNGQNCGWAKPKVENLRGQIILTDTK